jgi:hypothetical protein
VATATDDIEEIRRRMAQIRRELHEDVKEVVEGAEEVTDWRRYVKLYPWAATGAAFATGYLIVPKRRRSVPRDVARQSDVAEVREELRQAREPEPEAKKRRKSLIGAALGMLAPLALRAAKNYAMGYMEQWIVQKQQEYMTAAGPPPGAPQSPDRPGQGPGRPGGMPPGPGTSQSPGGPGRPGGPRGV